jgi:hypothetical protein
MAIKDTLIMRKDNLINQVEKLKAKKRTENIIQQEKTNVIIVLMENEIENLTEIIEKL